MVELKFTALKSNGQPITGTITANSSTEGKKKIQKLVEKNKLKLSDVQKKSTYLYRVRKGKEKPIRGEQKAFSKKEVASSVYSGSCKTNKIRNIRQRPPQCSKILAEQQA